MYTAGTVLPHLAVHILEMFRFMKQLEAFERHSGTKINDPVLKKIVFTHPSYAKSQEQKTQYQRLEFLGDSVW